MQEVSIIEWVWMDGCLNRRGWTAILDSADNYGARAHAERIFSYFAIEVVLGDQRH